MSDGKNYQPLAWLAGGLVSLLLAPTIALVVILPNSSGFLVRLQSALYPAVVTVAEGLDFNLVAMAGGPSAGVQTQGTSTPTKLTGGGKTPTEPSVFGFNATLNSGSNGTYGHWNSQSPRCNGPVVAIHPQADPSNGFNFDVDCGGSTLQVRAKDNGEPGSGPSTTPADCNTPGKPDCLDLLGPVGDPAQQITQGNIQAHH